MRRGRTIIWRRVFAPRFLAAAVIALVASLVASAQALPNPYRAVDGWAKLPAGRTMGSVGDLMISPDGAHLWAIVRCDASARDRFGNE